MSGFRGSWHEKPGGVGLGRETKSDFNASQNDDWNQEDGADAE